MESRIIKFRAWNGQKMIIPAAINEYGWYETDRDFEDGRYSTSKFNGLMQFTGLKDKNGKEIYEGDICITGFYNHEMPTTYMNQEVSFEKGTFTVKSGAVEFEESRRNVPIQWVDEIEVIGNIFENKDLL